DGQGIFERDGWRAPMSGTRVIRFVRESGPAEPVNYRVSWTGNDGVFSTAPSIQLPLRSTWSLPIAIDVRSPGAHGALLSVHDPVTDAMVFRTQATVVAAESPAESDHSLTLAATLPLLGRRAHYVLVPDGAVAMTIALNVVHGSLSVAVLPSHGLFPNYYYRTHPQHGLTFTPGTYNITMRKPVPGTWTIAVDNTSAWREPHQRPRASCEAEYTITVKELNASLRPQVSDSGALDVHLENAGATLREPVLVASPGVLKSHAGKTLGTGLPNLFPIDVPQGAATLALHLRGT